MGIILRNIYKGFDEHLVVSRISLEVSSGELFVLLGSSGSGKSTLLRVVAGLYAPDSGNVELEGKDVTNLSPQQRNVGFVFQHYALFKHMSVAENVEFGLKVRGVSSNECRARRDELLELIGLGGMGARMPSQLSGGQRQRVALARALAFKPAVLLLDEPFGALDVKIRVQLRRMLKDIQRQLKVTTLLVTHDQEEAYELADRIGVLERGRLVEIGTPIELYHTPRSEYVATFVGGGNVMVGRAEKGMIRVGAAQLPFPEGSPKHEDGAPVRILFRPEMVKHQIEPFVAESPAFVIGQGTVRESSFAGATARVRFELETLRGVRPLAPAMNYGQRFASIEATQPSYQLVLPPAGEQRWVAIAGYHVLGPSGLRFLLCFSPEKVSDTAFNLGCKFVGASHGSATVLSLLDSHLDADDQRKTLEELRVKTSARPELRLEPKVRHGVPHREVVREVQEGYYDFVMFDRLTAESFEEKRRLAQLARRVLAYTGVPVLLTGGNVTNVAKILVCTAGGEPGKNDVKVAGRLARHIGARATIFHVLPEGADEKELSRVKRHLSHAQDLLAVFSLESEVKLGSGNPLAAIVQELNQGSYDLLVMGASWSRVQFQYHADDLVSRLIDSIDKPVLIVPTFE